jgi:hypothetical protein
VKAEIIRALCHFCDMYATALPLSKTAVFTNTIMTDFSKLWSTDRIEGISYPQSLERNFIPDRFRTKLETGLAVIVLKAMKYGAILKFRLNRENIKMRGASLEVWKTILLKREMTWKIARNICGIECATSQGHIVDWIFDRYIELVHDTYPLIYVDPPHYRENRKDTGKP